MGIEDQLKGETSFAEAWRPTQPGDQVIGEIVRWDRREGGEYDSYIVITLRQDDGREVAVHTFHWVLASELRKLKPKMGDRIGIKYLGQPEGKRYHNYKVVTDAPMPEIDWGEEPEQFLPGDPRLNQQQPPTQGFVPQEYGAPKTEEEKPNQFGEDPPWQ